MKRISNFRGPRYLVSVAWDHNDLVAVIAAKVRGGFELIDTVNAPLAAAESFADACINLADQLKRRRITSFRLLLGLPRSQVDMLNVELPPATTDELPEMVRNEVTRQLSDLPEDAVVDYQMLSTDDGPVRVEAAVLRSDTLAAINAIAGSLRTQPTQIVIRSLAIASLFRRQVKKVPDHAMLLNLMATNVDLSVLSRGRITFTRTVHVTTGAEDELDAAHLADEIRRTLFVAPRNSTDEGDDPDAEVHNVYVFADLDQRRQLIADLADELEMTVSILDPLAGIEVRGGRRPEGSHRFAAPIGMIWDYLNETARLDFAHPKRKAAPPSLGRRVAVYAIGAVVAVAIVVMMLKSDVDQARQQAVELAEEVVAQEALIKKLRGKTIVLDAVANWENREVDWLDELRRLSTKFPPADAAVVQRMTLAPAAGNRGLVSMSVRVRDPEIVATLEQDLRDERHQVSSQRISQSASDQEYAVRFETRVVVTPQPKQTE